MVVCLARKDLYFGALWWDRRVISAGEMAGGRVSFSDTTGYLPNQGAVLKKSSLRGVHPGDFPFRQGENERRPISCAYSSWIKRSTLMCRKITRVLHPVVSFPLAFISTLVYLYSTEYMGEDPHLPRFMSNLSLFTFFMLILVTTDNCVQMFVGWEGVRLSFYFIY